MRVSNYKFGATPKMNLYCLSKMEIRNGDIIIRLDECGAYCGISNKYKLINYETEKIYLMEPDPSQFNSGEVEVHMPVEVEGLEEYSNTRCPLFMLESPTEKIIGFGPRPLNLKYSIPEKFGRVILENYEIAQFRRAGEEVEVIAESEAYLIIRIANHFRFDVEA